VNEPVRVYGKVHLHGQEQGHEHVGRAVPKGRYELTSTVAMLTPTALSVDVDLIVLVAVAVAVNAHALVHDQA
jgi:hypothetical protein